MNHSNYGVPEDWTKTKHVVRDVHTQRLSWKAKTPTYNICKHKKQILHLYFKKHVRNRNLFTSLVCTSLGANTS